MAIAEAEIQADIRPGMEITEDELVRLPRDGRKWELVDGRLTEVPTSILHEGIIFNLIVPLTPFVRGHGIVTVGRGGFRMTSGNVRAPDISFTRKERFPRRPCPKHFRRSGARSVRGDHLAFGKAGGYRAQNARVF